MAIHTLADLLRSEHPEMLRAPVTAQLLDVRIQMLYAMVRRNEVPHVRVGKHVRFPSHKIREYIEAGGTRNESSEQ